MMFNEVDVVRTTAVLTFLLAAGIAVVKPQAALGLLLGGLMSVLTLRLMIIDATRLLQLARTVRLSNRDVSRFNRKSFLKRCALYAATLGAAAASPHLNYLAAFFGLLMPRLAIVYHMLQGRIKGGT